MKAEEVVMELAHLIVNCVAAIQIAEAKGSPRLPPAVRSILDGIRRGCDAYGNRFVHPREHGAGE